MTVGFSPFFSRVGQQTVGILQYGCQTKGVHPLDHSRPRIGRQVETACVTMFGFEGVFAVNEAVPIARQTRPDRVTGQE